MYLLQASPGDVPSRFCAREGSGGEELPMPQQRVGVGKVPGRLQTALAPEVKQETVDTWAEKVG